MANLSLRHIYKIYPPRRKKITLKERFSKTKKEPEPEMAAVSDFSMEIEDGEFIVFVGPSGCGKSTTLRMIAGLEDITAGELYIDGKLMNNEDPMNRDIAMVFQNYALYPHMTVFDNIAFGLKMRKIPVEITTKDGTKKTVMRHMPKEEIKERVHWAAEILGIENLLDRKPTEMSGGQCQRVALGRAIVRGPKVFLFDEPLSNLDAKLRTSMRSEIVKLHRALKTTFIYVTHDQVEAMTMGTRIVVMKNGVIQQIDTPTRLFHDPCNTFVAGFLGTPQMNLLPVILTVSKAESVLVFPDGQKLTLKTSELQKLQKDIADGKEHSVILGVRGEHLTFDPNGIEVGVSFVEVLGSSAQVFCALPGLEKDLVMVRNEELQGDLGEKIRIGVDAKNLHFFDPETTKSLKESA
ncbi:MAG: ABC transporter ATP-binding protein [Candidatus Enteromonas sp.]